MAGQDVKEQGTRGESSGGGALVELVAPDMAVLGAVLVAGGGRSGARAVTTIKRFKLRFSVN